MHIRRRQGWEIKESEATSERAFFNRRTVTLGLGAAAATAVGAATLLPARRAMAGTDPSAGLYPFKHNDAYKIDRAVTPASVNENYNNFYEFGTTKSVASAAQALKVRPWTVKISGLVDKEQEVGIDDLLKAMPLEERLYRHRCVEAWSMAVPWSGFALKALVDFAKPQSGAKYVEMQTFMDPDTAPDQALPLYPWPYVEGLSMAEAMHPMTFMVTGAYGKPLVNQMGAPLRLAVPWKYGFKSIKSIVRISFVAQRPVGMWEKLQSAEYGFWANVNPKVPHPRWSQASEDVLGTYTRKPTLLYNGYAEQVAELYKNLQGERLFV